MYKKVFQTFPLLLVYISVFSLLYAGVSLAGNSSWGSVVDSVQLHTFSIVGSIVGISLIVWCLTIWYLSKYEWFVRIIDSKFFKLLSTIVFSIYVGGISAYLFLAFHIDIENIGRTTEWLQQYPQRFGFTWFILSLLTLGLILLIGEVYMGAGISLVIYFVIAIVNYYKKIYRSEPLFPNDFTQIGQLNEVIPFVSKSIPLLYTLMIILILVFSIFVWYKSPKLKVGWITRLFLLIPIAYLIYSFLLYEDTFTEKYYDKYTSIMPWNQQNNYYYNGPVIGMISNIKLDIVEKPGKYNREVMANTLNEIKEVAKDDKGSQKEFLPNIVFLMNETFWDPTQLDVKFSEDPMPNIRRLMTINPSGTLFSPSFGGETANVEFEALTSYSMDFINPGGNPFNQLLANQKYPSFVTYLNNRGYFSEAIHPNSGNLYRRKRVYPNLEFNRWKFLEDMTYTEKDNKQFVSDESVVKELLSTIEEKDQPAFIHAVTIANHLPYDADKYKGGSTIEVEGEGLSQESKTRIEVYAEGIKRSDTTIQRLYEKIQSMEEPTLVVFFGDHLPSIGANLKAFKETGFGDEESQQKMSKFYETPLLFMSNFDTGLPQEIGTVSPIYIAPMVTDSLDFKTHLFYEYMNEMKQEIPAFKDLIYIDKEAGTVHSMGELPSTTKSLLQDYHRIQYDTLAGKEYILDTLYD
ncbi:LTA synthase family protein [Halobacillus yeomjeoni]|uniref:LTA synthase family protein n=1 Tax=Halobacillus yeomjeoni TaxID=311194 RepID=UPI001CD6FEC4|nr:LTA synthase family protein [Halobacillus yeomjeoni]MCA0984698.1 LTA synthase family protein [Halobacillus yeomjeoni]